METAKISIIMPVYNTVDYLEKSIESVREQTFPEFELICVDDGSSDGSLEILQEYAKKDTRIKVFQHEHDGRGAAGARNMALEHVTGEYIAFLDSDDYMDVSLLEKVYVQAEKTQADIVLYDAQRFDGITGAMVPTTDIVNYSFYPEQEVFSKEDVWDGFFQVSGGTVWNKLFRHSMVKENGLTFQKVYGPDDLFFAYTAMASAERITSVREKLYFYRMNNATSQMQNLSTSPLSSVKACLSIKRWLEDKGLYDKCRKSFLNYEISLEHFMLQQMKTYDSFSELYHALKNGGFSEMGFDDVKKEEIYVPEQYEWYLEVTQQEIGEYLYKKREEQQGFVYVTQHVFPRHLVQPMEKIVLYGAGDAGKAYYIQNLAGKYCEIIGWVDKNYQTCPFPVQGRELLNSATFDKVLIAIANEKIAEEIKKELMSMGITANRILWR